MDKFNEASDYCCDCIHRSDHHECMIGKRLIIYCFEGCTFKELK